jgi:Flp pilus assembly protein TadD
MTKRSATSPKRLPAASRVEEIGRVAQQDLPRAIRLAKTAKAAGVAAPLIHHLIALGHKDEGRYEDAVAELGLGLALEPENARLTTEVGFCLLEMGRRREAAGVFSVAVKLDPRSPHASFGYGWAAERIGALDIADQAFQRTLALQPDHADALAGLSGLAVRRREWDLAKFYAERAAAIDPRQTDAITNLARVELGKGQFAAAERSLRAILALPDLKPQARANALFLLGDALDGAKRYAEAFACYAEGKDMLRQQFAATYDKPRVNTAYDGVHEILAEYRDSPAAAWARPASPPPSDGGERGHAFLVGFPRSGTTLLEQVLAAHPDVVALDERPVMIDVETEFLTRPGGVRQLASLASEALQPFRTLYWKRVAEFGVEPRGKLFIDKHPLSTFRLPLIAKMFPYAKILFAIRDPRDVVFSCFRRSFNMNATMYEFNSLERAARFYDAVMSAGQVYLDELPIDAYRLRYEDLVADFDGAAGGVCDFLGLDRTEALRDFAAQAQRRRIATPSSGQVTRGLYGEGVGQWRNYAEAMAPALPVLRPWLEAFGYELD